MPRPTVAVVLDGGSWGQDDSKSQSNNGLKEKLLRQVEDRSEGTTTIEDACLHSIDGSTPSKLRMMRHVCVVVVAHYLYRTLYLQERGGGHEMREAALLFSRK